MSRFTTYMFTILTLFFFCGSAVQGQQENEPKLETRFYAIPGWVDQENFLDLIPNAVCPNDWEINGGLAQLEFLRGRLMISASAETHEQFELLLKLLTNAPIPVDTDRLELEKALDQIVEENYERKSLTLALEELSADKWFHVRFDTKAIKDSGVSDIEALLIRQNAQGISLRAALDLWLERWELGFYLDKNTIVVTTKEKVSDRLSLCVYDIPIGCSYDETSEAFTDLVYPDSWSENAGLGYISPFGGRILVLQSERGHRQIQRLLNLINGKPRVLNAREVKIEAALKEPIELSFKDVPAAEAVGQLREKLGLSIQWAMANLESSMEKKLTFQCKGIRLESALNRIARALNVNWVIEHESIYFVDSDASYCDTLSSHNLLDYEQKIAATGFREDITDLAPRHVLPEFWQDNGGVGTSLVLGNQLLVRQTRAGQEKLAEFRNQLASKPRAATDSEKAIQNALKIVKPMTFNKLSLEEFIELLRDEFQIEIALDETSFRAFDPNPSGITIRGKTVDLTLEQVLDQTLAKSDLNWILRDETLTIVPKKVYADALETEVYQIFMSTEWKNDFDIDALIGAFQSGVNPDSWEGNGGVAAISIVAEIPALVISQTRDGQRKSAAFVEQLERMTQEDQLKANRRTVVNPDELVDKIYVLPVFEEEEEGFMALLKTFVAPQTWKSVAEDGTVSGGRGDFRIGEAFGARTLFVRQTEAVHRQINEFLDALEEPPKEDFPLKRALGTVVDIQLDTTLEQAIANLSEKYKCPVDVEKESALAAGIDLDKVSGRLTVRGISLRSAFNLLLRPAGLVCAPEGAKLWIGVDKYSQRRRIGDHSILSQFLADPLRNAYLCRLNNGAFPDYDAKDERICAIWKRVQDEELAGNGQIVQSLRRLVPQANWSDNPLDRCAISLSSSGLSSKNFLPFPGLLLVRQTPYGHDQLDELEQSLVSQEKLWTSAQMNRYVAFNSPIGANLKGKTLAEAVATVSEKLNTPILVDSRAANVAQTTFPFDPGQTPLRETLNRLTKETGVVWGVVDETILLTDVQHAEVLMRCRRFPVSQSSLESEYDEGGLQSIMGSMDCGGGGDGGLFALSEDPFGKMSAKGKAAKSGRTVEEEEEEASKSDEAAAPAFDSDSLAAAIAQKTIEALKSYLKEQNFPKEIGEQVAQAIEGMQSDQELKKELEQEEAEALSKRIKQMENLVEILQWRVPSALWGTKGAVVECVSREERENSLFRGNSNNATTDVPAIAQSDDWLIVRQTSGVLDQLKDLLDECNKTVVPRFGNDCCCGSAGDLMGAQRGNGGQPSQQGGSGGMF